MAMKPSPCFGVRRWRPGRESGTEIVASGRFCRVAVAKVTKTEKRLLTAKNNGKRTRIPNGQRKRIRNRRPVPIHEGLAI